MATWNELSRDCLRDARRLASEGRWRGSVNRSYYAAYDAVTQKLVSQGTPFARGWNNPPHEQLLDLIANGLALPPSARRRMRTLLRVLRRAREDADYRPGRTVDRALALTCIRSAIAILEDLEVPID